MKNVYSPLKILKHLPKIERAKQGTLECVFAQVDFTNKCNFNCRHCSSKFYEDYTNAREAQLDKDMLMQFLFYLRDRGLAAVEITGGGEPTLHPDFAAMTVDIRTNFEFALVTNGSMLNKPEILDSIAGAKWVRISVDAANSYVHEEVHGIGIDYFFTICSAAEKIKKLSPDTVVGFSFVITDKNFHQIVDAVKVAKNNGFDNIRFSSCYHPQKPGLPEFCRKKTYELLQMAEEYTDSSFTVFTFKERVEEVYNRTKSFECYYSAIVKVMAANSIVYPCCALKNRKRHRLGTSFGIAAGTTEIGGLHDTEFCPACWMDKKNELVEYMLYPQEHTNFP